METEANLERFQFESKIKKRLKPREICVQAARFLKDMLEYAYSLDFYDRPNYKLLKGMLHDTLQEAREYQKGV